MGSDRRAQPLDWTRGAGRTAVRSDGGIDIVIPVYGAARETEACLASVVRHTDLARHRVTIVVDGPQATDVEAVLAHATFARILRNATRLGFVGSVNRGMSETTGDVLLLNSDTIVTSRWLEKMREALESNGDVASVTPLSNHSTLTSIPRGFAENTLSSGFSVDGFADLVDRVSPRNYPAIPTAVGVCMLIRRAALDDVGLFDAETFGLGYGEENDFSFRALRRGWIHLCDDATFIFHEGGRSFSRERLAAQKTAARALRAKHPDYYATIGAFMRADPLHAVRARVREALSPRRHSAESPRKVVHVVHGYPPFSIAGTEAYAHWLVGSQRQRRDVAVYARLADPARARAEAIEFDDGGVRVRLVTNNFDQRNPFSRNAIDDRRIAGDFASFLAEERPELIHVHHLGGHAFSLMSVARRARVPIVMQVQDWWQICARVNLENHAGERCSGPSAARCRACVSLTRVAPRSVMNAVLHRVRRLAARNALLQADAFISGSEFIRRDYERAGVVAAGTPWYVLPYGVSMPFAETSRPPAQLPVRVGFIGSILPHKGLHVAAGALSGIPPGKMELHAWGNDSLRPDYAATVRRLAGDASLTIHGKFSDEDKQRILDSIDVLVMPSIGLESFGLAAREALARGVPVIASADGALLELFDSDPAGILFPPGDVAALRRIFETLVADCSTIDAWRSRIPRVKTAEEHADEVEEIYRALLQGGA